MVSLTHPCLCFFFFLAANGLKTSSWWRAGDEWQSGRARRRSVSDLSQAWWHLEYCRHDVSHLQNHMFYWLEATSQGVKWKGTWQAVLCQSSEIIKAFCSTGGGAQQWRMQLLHTYARPHTHKGKIAIKSLPFYKTTKIIAMRGTLQIDNLQKHISIKDIHSHELRRTAVKKCLLLATCGIYGTKLSLIVSGKSAPSVMHGRLANFHVPLNWCHT